MDTIPKRIELFFRRKIQQFFLDDKSTIILQSAEKSIDTSSPLKVVFLRQDHLGDVIVSIPLIRELHKHFPTFELQIILGKSNFSLAPFLRTYTTKEWKYSKKIIDIIRLVLALRKERFDVVIDIHDKASLTSTILIWMIRSRYAIGLAKGSSKVLTHRVELPEGKVPQVVDLYLLPLLPFGIDASNVDYSLEFPKSEVVTKNSRRVFINLNGSQRIRYWGTENFILCIQKLQVEFPDFDIVVSCTKDYDEELQEILSKTTAKHTGYFTTFFEVTTEIDKSQFVITPDTVVPHICEAWNIPCVVLYLRYDSYTMWRPKTTQFRPVISPDEIMTSIAPDDVIDAFKQLYGLVNQSQ